MPIGPWILELPGPLLGTLRIEAFGVALAIGLVLGVLVSARLAEQARLDRSLGADALVLALFGALLGARLLFAVENAKSLSFRDVLSLGLGGLSAYGAFLFAALAAAVWLRRRREPAWRWLDVAAPGALLAASVARLGSHLGAGDSGRVLGASAPTWLSRVSNSIVTRPGSQTGEAPWLSAPTHPSALYEAFGTLLLALAVLVAWRHQRRAGDIALLSVLGYAVLRLLTELSRERASVLVGLTATECYALISAVFAATHLVRRYQRGEYST